MRIVIGILFLILIGCVQQPKKTAELPSEINKPKVKITIKDNGRGMPEDHISNIFDPFITTKEIGKGTGLGLSISQAIIEKHKGKLTVESNVGKGSEFIIKTLIYKKIA